MKQARIDLTTGEVLGTRTVPEPIVGANQWVPLIEEPQPAYDPAAEVVTRVEETEPDKSQVRRRWIKRMLTAEELAERQAAQDAANAERAERNQIRAVVDALRAGSLNGAQVQQVLARLIVQVMREEAE